MCGIVGLAGDLNLKHREIFADLLTVCQFRGRDATGVIMVHNNDEVKTHKMLGTPDILLGSKKYSKEIDVHAAKVLIGHCRAKTVGGNVVRNAHPFEHDHITGVHNGSLRGYMQHPEWKGFDVDSDFLYHLIAKEGIEAALPQISGAFALVFWDAQKKTLNFIRNNERPLFFTFSKDQKVLFWASEVWMFGAVGRQIDLWDGDEEKKIPKYISLEPNKLFQYQIDWTKSVPSQIFTSFPPVEIYENKEVRGNLGNFSNSRGTTGSYYPQSTGGSVARPFDKKPDEELDETYVKENGVWRQVKPDPNLEGLMHTLGHSTKSPSTTLPALVGQKALKNQTGTSRPTLSLVSTSSKNSPRKHKDGCCVSPHDANEKHENPSNLTFDASKHGYVDRRTIAGLTYITDRQTGKEFTEESFFRFAGDDICQFCKSPTDISDVAYITVDPQEFNKSLSLSFLCYSCFAPDERVFG